PGLPRGDKCLAMWPCAPTVCQRILEHAYVITRAAGKGSTRSGDRCTRRRSPRCRRNCKCNGGPAVVRAIKRSHKNFFIRNFLCHWHSRACADAPGGAFATGKSRQDRQTVPPFRGAECDLCPYRVPARRSEKAGRGTDPGRKRGKRLYETPV